MDISAFKKSSVLIGMFNIMIVFNISSKSLEVKTAEFKQQFGEGKLFMTDTDISTLPIKYTKYNKKYSFFRKSTFYSSNCFWLSKGLVKKVKFLKIRVEINNV